MLTSRPPTLAYRSLRAASCLYAFGVDVSQCGGDQSTEHASCFTVALGECVRVDAKSGRGVGMAETPRHRANVRPGCDQLCGGEVPKIVESVAPSELPTEGREPMTQSVRPGMMVGSW